MSYKLDLDTTKWAIERSPMVLEEAVDAKDEETVRFLLGKVCFSANEIARCLEKACENEDTQMAKLLIDSYKGDINDLDHYELFSLCLTVDMLHVFISAGFDVNAESRDGNKRTALLQMCWENFDDDATEHAKVLIDHGASLDAQDESGDSALFHSVLSGAFDMVRLLVESGARLLPHRVRNETLVMVALKGEEDTAMIEYLLDKGDSVRDTDSDGFTVLHHMCKSVGNVSEWYSTLLKLFLERGADLNALAGGQTPLMIASRYGNYNATDALIQFGADIHALDLQGRSALDLAVYNNTRRSSRIMELLNRQGTPFHQSGNAKKVGFMEDYAPRLLDALHHKLLGQAIEVFTDNMSPGTFLKTNVDHDASQDVPLDRLFDLPFHRLAEGLRLFAEKHPGADVDPILSLLKTISEAIHNNPTVRSAMRDKAATDCDAFAAGSPSKRLKTKE